MNQKTKFILDETDLPKTWYNIQADSPLPPTPVINPLTKEPVTPEFLEALFPKSIIQQEITTDKYIDIPEPVRDMYKLWRPTPLVRAIRLEKALNTSAHIYYKYEGASPSGSHKTNTALAQAYFNKMDGIKALTTETGAGQWGSALSMACNFFDINLEVYMVKVSYGLKPYRRVLMHTFGAQVFPSPTEKTEIGKKFLEEDPNHPGSLGIAISEAVEVALKSNGTKKYSLGSVLNHVLMHQTIIGEECLKQMDMADEYPDVVIGCVGGGSNFAGVAFPFLRENLVNGRNTKLLAVEPKATPSLTRGLYAFDYGDTAKMAPIVKMNTLGHTFVPAKIHAGGLRYHGMAPLVSAFHNSGHIDAVAYGQLDVFKSAVKFAQTEGIIPAPESAHAVHAVIEEAIAARDNGNKKVILFNLSGHGHFDLSSYQAYLADELQDYAYPEDAINKIEEVLPKLD